MRINQGKGDGDAGEVLRLYVEGEGESGVVPDQSIASLPRTLSGKLPNRSD
jgi:hypothetical protein